MKAIAPISLPDDEIHLWRVNVEDIAVAELIVAAQQWLEGSELARYQRLQLAAHRHRFLLGRWLLRTTLSRYLAVQPGQWQFSENEYGKPAITGIDTDLRFNLSHSGDWIVLALATRAEIGVDIENNRRQRRFAALGERHFAAPELDALRQRSGAQQQQLFYELWTLKEACLKARGSGLLLPLNCFAFDLSSLERLQLTIADSLQEAVASWQVWQLADVPGYELALALRDTTAVPRRLRSWCCSELMEQGVPELPVTVRRSTALLGD